MTLNKEVLKGYVCNNDKVVVGVSGGADSMCLLSLLLECKKYVDFSVIAIHINHNIRNEEAVRDEEFVRKFCLENSVEFKSVHINTLSYAKKQGKTIEQAARELRYDVFNKVLKLEKANKLFIAHHKDDQAETVLMHILRGASIKGARGMSDISDKICRPLLNFSRHQIVEYNKINNIDFIKDSSNDDVHYSRNYIRHEVLPKLEKIYPNVVTALSSFASKCARDDDFIESLVPLEFLMSDGNKAELSDKIYNLNYALSSRLIKKAFESLNVFADIEEKHIKDVLNLFTLKNGSSINLPHEVKAYKEYNKVVIIKDKKIKSFSINFKLEEFNFEGYGKISSHILEEGTEIKFEKGEHYVDYAKIPKTAIWRNKKDGDIFAKFGSGSKKLCDYFTDKKVPLRIRDRIPVLAVGNKILVVAGLDISESVKITNNTQKIVKITYEKDKI